MVLLPGSRILDLKQREPCKRGETPSVGSQKCLCVISNSISTGYRWTKNSCLLCAEVNNKDSSSVFIQISCYFCYLEQQMNLKKKKAKLAIQS